MKRGRQNNGLSRFERRLDIRAGDAAFSAGPADSAQIEAVIARQFPNHWRSQDSRPAIALPINERLYIFTSHAPIRAAAAHRRQIDAKIAGKTLGNRGNA
jgi:hypothetical protein